MRTITTKKILLAGLLFVSAGVFAQSGGKVVLAKGAKYELASSIKMNMNMEAMGQAIEIVNESNTLNNLEVKDARPDSYLLANTLAKVKMTGSAMGQEMNFDSEKPEDLDGRMGEAFKGSLGKTTEVSISNTGKILEVKKDPSASDAGGGNPMMGGGMMSGLTGGSDDGGVGNMFISLPANAKAGSTWNESSEKDGTKSETVYTVKEMMGSNAIVTYVTTSIVDKKVEAQPGMEIQMNLKITAKGEAKVDAGSGLVQQRTIDVDASGTMDIMGQSAPITMKMSSVSTAKKL
jgi:Family of unknown function (DUF6263)